MSQATSFLYTKMADKKMLQLQHWLKLYLKKKRGKKEVVRFSYSTTSWLADDFPTGVLCEEIPNLAFLSYFCK